MARTAAPRPDPRIVTWQGKGTYAGWECSARADFRAGLLAELQTGEIGAVVRVLNEIVTEHNFPDANGDVAASMSDVDPYGGLIAAAEGIFDAIGKLPNR